MNAQPSTTKRTRPSRLTKADRLLARLAPVLGGRIEGLARTRPENDPLGEQFFGLVVVLPSGERKTLLLLADDDGHGPGTFEIHPFEPAR